MSPLDEAYYSKRVEKIERVARLMAQADGVDPDTLSYAGELRRVNNVYLLPRPQDQLARPFWESYRRAAVAVVDAL